MPYNKMDFRGNEAMTTRACGNFALTLSAILTVITAISTRTPPAIILAIVALAIVGVGLRIEAAIRER